jgi:hypothetical protein
MSLVLCVSRQFVRSTSAERLDQFARFQPVIYLLCYYFLFTKDIRTIGIVLCPNDKPTQWPPQPGAKHCLYFDFSTRVLMVVLLYCPKLPQAPFLPCASSQFTVCTCIMHASPCSDSSRLLQTHLFFFIGPQHTNLKWSERKSAGLDEGSRTNVLC